MIKNKILTFLIATSVSGLSVAQIKEEKLILERKREPEVKRIEKKKTSVPAEKNYPPETKIQEVVKYDIVDFPMASDFQPSMIQGVDVAPDFGGQHQRNYFRIGYGNYNQFLADANVSGDIQPNIELGADVHYTSNEGLKKAYPWKSAQQNAEFSGFMNAYGEKGRTNITANIDLHDYQWYGAEALRPEAETDLNQTYTQLQLNGNYDFYSKEILNNIQLKTSFLKDKFDANENKVDFKLNLSKYQISIGQEVALNLDLGLPVGVSKTSFKALEAHQASYFKAGLLPKLTFRKGDSYLMLGSEFSVLTSALSAQGAEEEKNSHWYWFPKAEALLGVSSELQFYAGIDGGLNLNSYAEYLSENPYLAPDLTIKPTETKYQFYIGLKWHWNEQISYDVKAKYAKINAMPFYKTNGLFNKEITTNRAAYDWANTYSVDYHNGTKSEIEANVHYTPLADLVLEGGLSFQKYQLENDEPVYNRPLLQMNVGAKYTMLNQKLFLGAKAFFVSDRTTNALTITPSPYFVNPPRYDVVEEKEQKVGGYADINLSAEYKINKNFSIFALANNLAGAKYMVYRPYKTLGTQIIGGLKVSF